MASGDGHHAFAQRVVRVGRCRRVNGCEAAFRVVGVGVNRIVQQVSRRVITVARNVVVGVEAEQGVSACAGLQVLMPAIAELIVSVTIGDILRSAGLRRGL